MTERKEKRGQAEGTISISSKGIGYVRVKDASGKPDKKNDIEIDPAYLNTALHGDTVRVLLHPRKKGENPSGEVVKVLSRSKAGFAGVIEEENGIFFLAPSDTRMYTDIVIPKPALHGAKAGDKAFAVIKKWADPKKAPEGEIAEVLGKPGENDAEMKGIALEKGFSGSFPPEVEKEANKLKIQSAENIKEEIAKRRDFRQVVTFTIDPEDAKDFDDALSFEELPNGRYEIGIHIADASHYVRIKTELDREAARRGTSVYLVDRTIPMLPEILSNDLCSLNPQEDKLTMSAVFEMDKGGKVHKEWFGKTVIHSNRRFTYEEAQKILNDGGGPYYHELKTLNDIAKKLTKKRFEEGAVSLEQEEVKFLLDEKGVPVKVFRKVRTDTNKLIEEFMLLANRKVAEFIAQGNEKVFVYRIHDLPDKEKMADLAFYLKKLGYHLPLGKGGAVSSRSLNELIERLQGREEKDTIQTAIIRSMAKAIYSTKNIGHFGLAFQHYTHFTSPIRRYPDIVVHRLLELYLQKGRISKDRWHEYEVISNFASQREKEAAEAERASIKYKQVEYMSYRIGEVYNGVITGVTDFGIFVEEKETKCEGLIRLKDLSDDFYMLNEKEMSIVGRKTKKKYKVGDKVKIRVKDSNLNKKVIDYEFVK